MSFDWLDGDELDLSFDHDGRRKLAHYYWTRTPESLGAVVQWCRKMKHARPGELVMVWLQYGGSCKTGHTTTTTTNAKHNKSDDCFLVAGRGLRATRFGTLRCRHYVHLDLQIPDLLQSKDDNDNSNDTSNNYINNNNNSEDWSVWGKTPQAVIDGIVTLLRLPGASAVAIGSSSSSHSGRCDFPYTARHTAQLRRANPLRTVLVWQSYELCTASSYHVGFDAAQMMMQHTNQTKNQLLDNDKAEETLVHLLDDLALAESSSFGQVQLVVGPDESDWLPRWAHNLRSGRPQRIETLTIGLSASSSSAKNNNQKHHGTTTTTGWTPQHLQNIATLLTCGPAVHRLVLPGVVLQCSWVEHLVRNRHRQSSSSTKHHGNTPRALWFPYTSGRATPWFRALESPASVVQEIGIGDLHPSDDAALVHMLRRTTTVSALVLCDNVFRDCPFLGDPTTVLWRQQRPPSPRRNPNTNSNNNNNNNNNNNSTSPKEPTTDATQALANFERGLRLARAMAHSRSLRQIRLARQMDLEHYAEWSASSTPWFQWIVIQNPRLQIVQHELPNADTRPQWQVGARQWQADMAAARQYSRFYRGVTQEMVEMSNPRQRRQCFSNALCGHHANVQLSSLLLRRHLDLLVDGLDDSAAAA